MFEADEWLTDKKVYGAKCMAYIDDAFTFFALLRITKFVSCGLLVDNKLTPIGGISRRYSAENDRLSFNMQYV